MSTYAKTAENDFFFAENNLLRLYGHGQRKMGSRRMSIQLHLFLGGANLALVGPMSAEKDNGFKSIIPCRAKQS